MAKYNTLKFIYPPRPKNAIPDYELFFWDNMTLVSQPKMNGSNSTIYTDGVKVIVMNRHGDRLTNVKVSDDEILKLYRGSGWLVINAEYMNKSKKDENGKIFNHKFVIFDILVYNGEYLVGKTFDERIKLLDVLYGVEDSEKEYLYNISENVYRVKSYYNGFKLIYDKLTVIDMVEGLVMKRRNAKLELATTEMNNVKSQLKCRKSTKNYKC